MTYRLFYLYIDKHFTNIREYELQELVIYSTIEKNYLLIVQISSSRGNNVIGREIL